MDESYHPFRSRGTPSWLLFFTQRGAGFFRSAAGEVRYARPGELLAYEPGVLQEYGTLPGRRWSFHWVRFTPRPAWLVWLRWPRVRPAWGLRALEPATPSRRRMLASEFERLHRDLRFGTPARTDLAMNTIERMLILVAEHLSPTRGRPLDDRILRVLEAIATRPEVVYRVPDMAREAGLSASRFAHLFRRETGMSVINAVLQTRLREAARHLALTRLPVSRIALALGFNSPFYFSLRFRRQFRLSPTQYRRRALPPGRAAARRD